LILASASHTPIANSLAAAFRMAANPPGYVEVLVEGIFEKLWGLDHRIRQTEPGLKRVVRICTSNGMDHPVSQVGPAHQVRDVLF
jgi:hypothetical protein